jgi:hypothetical protein
MEPIFQGGKCVYTQPSIHEIRDYAMRQTQVFNSILKNGYPVGLEKGLHDLKMDLIQLKK